MPSVQPLSLVLVTLLALGLRGPGVVQCANLLQNGGFESLSHWRCSNFHCSLSSQHHSGQHSVHLTGRHHQYDGPSQDVNVTAGHSYDVTAYVKLLKEASANGEKLQVMMTVDAPDGHHYIAAATHLSATVADGWIKMTGRFDAPLTSILRTRLKIQIGAPGAEGLIDDVTMTEVTSNGSTDWRKETDTVIDTIRKSDIHVQVTNSRNLDPADVNIQIVQKSKSFPWGTAVKAAEYNNNAANGKYRDFIHSHFNWAVLANALKWPHTEHRQGQLYYNDSLEAIHRLKSHGLKMRGHNLVWSVYKNVPDWVKQLSGDDLRHAVQKHIGDAMNHTRGLLEHWDVNNENLHGQWFQDTLHQPDYNLDIFRMAHQTDPSVKLFLNDFNVVVSSQYTQAYLQQARQFKAANVGLYGMGAQGHFHVETQPDPHAVKRNLDTLAQAGVPIWITELDATAANETTRAQYYETALRALYGHPAVEGIVFWGFWGPITHRGEPGSLVSGNNFQLNEAGRRVLDLLENEWMTDVTRVLADSHNNFTVRGFHGEYEVRVNYRGQPLTSATQRFTLGKQTHNVHITL